MASLGEATNDVWSVSEDGSSEQATVPISIVFYATVEAEEIPDEDISSIVRGEEDRLGQGDFVGLLSPFKVHEIDTGGSTLFI